MSEIAIATALTKEQIQSETIFKGMAEDDLQMIKGQLEELENFLDEHENESMNIEWFGLRFFPDFHWHYANKKFDTIILEDEDAIYGNLEIPICDIFACGFEFCQDIFNVEYTGIDENLRMYVD